MCLSARARHGRQPPWGPQRRGAVLKSPFQHGHPCCPSRPGLRGRRGCRRHPSCPDHLSHPGLRGCRRHPSCLDGRGLQGYPNRPDRPSHLGLRDLQRRPSWWSYPGLPARPRHLSRPIRTAHPNRPARPTQPRHPGRPGRRYHPIARDWEGNRNRQNLVVVPYPEHRPVPGQLTGKTGCPRNGSYPKTLSCH